MAHYIHTWPGTHVDKPLYGKRPGEWTLPDHNYIGPGNLVVAGYPVDRDDLIALRHDQDYHNAQTEEDVRAADREAITEFWADLKDNYNWHSALGLGGIGIKYGVESVTGVLYPSMDTPPVTPSKRKLDKVGTAGPSKVHAMDPVLGAESKIQSSKSESDTLGTSTSVAFNPLVDRSLSNANKGTYKFKHKRLFSSYACSFGYKSVSGWIPKAGEKQAFLITPLCNIPVDAIPWWMSPQEFDNLPLNSEIVKVKCVIKPYGYRMLFLVKSSGLTYANSQADIVGCYATGLNNKYNGFNFQITFDSNNVMKPNDIVIDKGYNIGALWGQAIGTGTDKKITDSSFIPMCQGNITPMNTYFCQNIDIAENKGYATYLFDDLNTFLWKGVGHDIVYEYRPEVCMLKPSFTYSPARNGDFIIPIGAKFVGNQETKYSEWLGQVTGQDAPTLDYYNTNVSIPYDSVLEQSGIVARGMTNT